jgi:alkylhydroperoxidase/carboxymuconolactone decarboxylase family protein YurZ
VEEHYWKASTFAEAIQHVLYEPEAKQDLDHADRQRCLISILATRAEMFPLAIHTYIGLLEGVGVREIRNIFFLVGVYSGIPGMINGIDVLNEVLRIFQSEWNGGLSDAATVHKLILARLKAQFSVGAFGLQLVQSVAKDLSDDKFNLLFGTIRERAQRTGIWFGDGGDPV